MMPTFFFGGEGCPEVLASLSSFNAGYVWEVEKETPERKGKWKDNVESFTPFDLKMI